MMLLLAALFTSAFAANCGAKFDKWGPGICDYKTTDCTQEHLRETFCQRSCCDQQNLQADETAVGYDQEAQVGWRCCAEGEKQECSYHGAYRFCTCNPSAYCSTESTVGYGRTNPYFRDHADAENAVGLTVRFGECTAEEIADGCDSQPPGKGFFGKSGRALCACFGREESVGGRYWLLPDGSIQYIKGPNDEETSVGCEACMNERTYEDRRNCELNLCPSTQEDSVGYWYNHADQEAQVGWRCCAEGEKQECSYHGAYRFCTCNPHAHCSTGAANSVAAAVPAPGGLQTPSAASYVVKGFAVLGLGALLYGAGAHFLQKQKQQTVDVEF